MHQASGSGGTGPVVQRREDLTVRREFLTAAEVAHLLGVHVATVYRRGHELPGCVRIGQSWRWRRADVEDFIGRPIEEGAA